MTTIKKTIGRLPQWIGDYDSSKTYKQKNRVTYLGSEFQSLIDNNTSVPATIDAKTHELVVNANWKVISNGTTPYTVSEQLKDLQGKLEQELQTLEKDGVVGRLSTLEDTVSSWDTKEEILSEVEQTLTAYVKKKTGYDLSANDFTTTLKNKLDALPTATALSQQLSGKTDTGTTTALTNRVKNIEDLIGDASNPDADDVINKVREMITFFDGITEEKTLAGMLATLKTELEAELPSSTNKLAASNISGLATVATSGSYNDLTNKPTIPSTAHKVTVNSGVKKDGSTAITGTSATAAASPSVTLGDSGVTAGAYGDSAAKTPGYGGTFKVPYVRVNSKGIVTEVSAHDVTLPASVDTHHKTGIKAGASGTNSNSAATNPYIKVLDETTYRAQVQLKGSGGTTVTSDANGVITINSETGGGAAYTPTLSSAPTSSTTSYVKDGQTVTFEIGQMCRVANAESDTGYTFYMLHNISNGAATWAEMGTPLERVRISVQSNQTTGLNALRQAATIKVTSAKSGVLYNGTIEGDSVTVKVEPGDTYTVEGSSVSGYGTPATQTYTAELEGQRTVTMTYSQTAVTVNFSQSGGDDSDISGVKPTVNGTALSNGGTVMVATGSTVEVVFPEVDGYDTPVKQTFTATGSAQEKQGLYTTTVYFMRIRTTDGNANFYQSVEVTVRYGSNSKTVKDGDTIKLPTQIEPIIEGPDVPPYKFSIHDITNNRITVKYLTEVLTVYITKNTGSGDLSSMRITVKDSNGSTLGTLADGEALSIFPGTTYTATPSDAPDGYSTPDSITRTAVDDKKTTLTFEYTEVKDEVDLGLPSGRIWATGNIVKNADGTYAIGSETERGCYFSHGNIEGHNASDSGATDDGYTFDYSTYQQTPGYTLTESYSADGGYDAARECLGGAWYTPAQTDFQELIDNCTSSWETVDGVAGRKFTSKINGKSVFFPVTGQFMNSGTLNSSSDIVYNWTREKRPNQNTAYRFRASNSDVRATDSAYRQYGLTIRAIK